MILETISSRDLLIDAYKFYSRKDARAHDALKIIIDRNDMTAAVIGCLNQAQKEEEPDKQNLNIQAACFGKKFYPGVAIEDFQTTCRSIRMANICRAQNIDPTLEVDLIIDNLLEKKQFSLALWMVNWLKIPGDQKILLKWSEYLIKNSFLRDDEVAAKIQQTLGPLPVIPYADIAKIAIERNRHKLAIKLIDNEGQSVRQIPLLLRLKQYDMVLSQALSTCDSNLIFFSIFELRESIGIEEKFRELLKKHPSAFKYYCNFLAVTDISKLILVSHSENAKDELALCLMGNKIESALNVAKRNKQDFASQQLENRIKLSKFQNGLYNLEPPPRARRSTWVGLSISDTIINLIMINEVVKAKECQKKLDMNDRKYKTLEQIALNQLPKLVVPSSSQ